MSADAPPPNLSAEGGDQFERTISRLTEMQTHTSANRVCPNGAGNAKIKANRYSTITAGRGPCRRNGMNELDVPC